jgi:predicted secreted protein
MVTRTSPTNIASRHRTAGAAFSVLLLMPTAAVADAIAVADGERTGVRAEIMELKRTSGDVLTLRFTVVNEGSERLDIRHVLNERDASQIHLIDAANQKKYLVVRDSQNNCVCSEPGAASRYLDPGQALNLWARFPAPPAEVSEVSLVLPRFIPVDVPISQ